MLPVLSFTPPKIEHNHRRPQDSCEAETFHTYESSEEGTQIGSSFEIVRCVLEEDVAGAVCFSEVEQDRHAAR